MTNYKPRFAGLFFGRPPAGIFRHNRATAPPLFRTSMRPFKRQGVKMEAPPFAGRYTPAPAPTRGWFVLLVGVLFPAFTIAYELVTRLCANALFDPLATLAHLAIVVAVPALNFKLWLLRRREQPAARGWLFAGAAAMAVSFSYALLFLPIYPIAAIGVVYFGLGLLPFAPFAAGAAGTAMVLSLGARDSRPIGRLLLGGTLAGLLVVLAIDVPTAITRHAVLASERGDAPSRARAVQLMRQFGSRELLLRYCHDRSGFTGGLLGLIVERSYQGGHSVAAARELYYRVTGEDYSTARPRWKGHGWRFTENFNWDMDQGGAQVGGRVAGLELASSRIDASMDADDAVAYLEWTAEFANRNEWTQREARLTLALPPGGVVSRATLWVNGVEREAAFASRALAREAYERVVSARRDPLLVTTHGADQVLVQMFPVPPKGSSKIRIGITAPLSLGNDDRATLAMPAIIDRNFNIDGGLRHAVWVEGDGREALADAGFVTIASDGPVVRRRASFSDKDLVTRRPRISLSRNPKAEAVDSGAILQTILREPREPPGSFFLLLDGSLRAKSARAGLISALERIPLGARVGFGIASDTPVLLPLQAWTPLRREEWLELLTSHEFAGGHDNQAALAQALAALEGEPRATLLWMHAPQGFEFREHDAALEQVFARGRPSAELWMLPVEPGPNKLVKHTALFARARTLAWSGDAGADIGAALSDYFDEAPRWTIRRVPGSGGIASGSLHAEKLWALNEVEDLITRGPGFHEQAVALAARHRLVTPVSGAVVLETDVEYLRAGLTPPDSGMVPTIPEPETWALIIIACLAFAWAWRQRRLSPA
jgi:hypothetical protein